MTAGQVTMEITIFDPSIKETWNRKHLLNVYCLLTELTQYAKKNGFSPTSTHITVSIARAVVFLFEEHLKFEPNNATALRTEAESVL